MHADLETDAAAAHAAGFECLEIWASKMREYLKSHSVADLKNLLSENNLEPLSINSIEHITFRTTDDYAKIKAECEEFCRIAAEIEAPYVVVVPGKMPASGDNAEIISESVRVLNELADIAEQHGVALAFEFLGQQDCSVQTLELSNEIVGQVNRDSVGMVLDSFHFYAGGSEIETIGKLDPKKLFIFHINDAEDLPKSELTDANRLLPGSGILPLTAIKAQLDNIGYNTVASIELFRPEYWERDPFELAAQANAAAKSVLNLT